MRRVVMTSDLTMENIAYARGMGIDVIGAKVHRVSESIISPWTEGDYQLVETRWGEVYSFVVITGTRLDVCP